MMELSPKATWWAACPDEQWPEDRNDRIAILSQFEGDFGDRRQEIVLIGRKLDESRYRQEIDACLLNDAEMNSGPENWQF